MTTQQQKRNGSLSKLRVIDLGTMVAGPVAATLMADFGADVIKVEQPGVGDTLRGVGPFYEGECLWWQVEGRNKRSITLDLRQAEGQALLKQLVAQADVVIENFRPGTLEKWNLGYTQLTEVNPSLVMLSVSGFGQTGPYAHRAGYDRIGLAFSGVMGMTGFPDRPPVRVGTSIADYTTACMGAFAVMMALYHRDANGGQGQQIDLALYESMFRFTDAMVPAYDKLGQQRTRTGNVHQAAAPGNTFQTQDGRFIIMTISSDALFRKLCQAMGQPEMADNPNYATHPLRWQHVQELNDSVAQWILNNPVETVTAALTQHGLAFSLVYTVADIFADAHYAARQNLATVVHPKLGSLRMQGVVPKMLGTPADPIAPAPALGQDNTAVFQDLLGIDAEEYQRLQDKGVI